MSVQLFNQVSLGHLSRILRISLLILVLLGFPFVWLFHFLSPSKYLIGSYQSENANRGLESCKNAEL